MQYVGMSKDFYSLIYTLIYRLLWWACISTSSPIATLPPRSCLRESYRVGGNVRKRTLANLSKLPMDAVDAIRRILKGEKLVSVEVAFKIVENGSRHHGHVDAVLSAMRQLGFEKLVGSRHSPERDLVVAMVVARILEPQSKLATSQWWHTTTLPEILGVSDAREDDLYAAMDWVLKRQEVIEKKLAARHLHNDGLALAAPTVSGDSHRARLDSAHLCGAAARADRARETW